MYVIRLYRYISLVIVTTVISLCALSQQNIVDSLLQISSLGKKTTLGKEQYYKINNNTVLVYSKPKPFSFITNLPKDALGMIKSPFERKSLIGDAVVVGSTAILLLSDEAIIKGVENFSKNIHLSDESIYNDVVKIKLGSTDVKILRLPGNLNTALYQMGQGFPGLLVGGGLYVYGKIKKDYRAVSTASQLAESFILMGISTQVIKRITGRQTPYRATVPGGKWQLFPSFSDYQNDTPNFDAFPSGHLATVMSTVTILAENYPEKKYIKPIGYTIIGLVGYSMMNNKVHWASDYPLALALGYVSAKQVVKHNRKRLQSLAHKKFDPELNFTLSRSFGVLTPGIVVKF